jgi:hypothetical protein
MLKDYIPVLLHVIVAVGFATVVLLLNLLLGRAGKRTAIKDTAYECGVVPEPGPQPRFSVVLSCGSFHPVRYRDRFCIRGGGVQGFVRIGP